MFHRDPLTPKYALSDAVLISVFKNIKEVIETIFDVDRYLQISGMINVGGFMNCMGQLRDNGSRNCGSCGRTSCEFEDFDASIDMVSCLYSPDY